LTVLAFIGVPYFTDASKAAPQRWILAGRLNLLDARALSADTAANLSGFEKRVGCA
jgi:hypothetical protein